MSRVAAFIRGNAIPLLILAGASLAVFGPSMGHDFLVNWDDPGYVTKNEAIKSITWANLKKVFSSFYVGNYAPLQMVSYMVDHAVWGMKPAGFIFGNIVYHTAAGALFYALLRRFSFSVGGALFAALFFLLHPVQVESVAWISQRKNVLAMVFYLLSFHSYLDWHRREGWNSAYLFSLTAFTAALLVKSVAVVLPLTLLLYDFCFPADRRQGKLLVVKLPYLLVAVVVGYLALLSQSAEYGGGGRTGFHGGSFWTTVLTMLPVYVTYLRMLVWPANLSVVYTPQIRTTVDPAVVAAALILLLLVALAVKLYRRNRGLFFWAAAIPIGLLPVSQVIPLVTLMNDRYLYFPILGVAACCGYLRERILSWVAAGVRPVVVSACALLLAVYGFLSFQRAKVWQNSSVLWEDATAKQPASAVAWYMLGEVLEKRERIMDAITAEEQARLTCKGVECRLVLRKLGELYLRMNMQDKAGERIAELLRLYPEAADGYTLSGHLSYQKGDLGRAEKAYLQALQLDSGMLSAVSALGNVYLATGRPELAMKQYEAVLRARKPTADLAYSMACASALMGNRRIALEHLDAALSLGYNKPDLILQNPELNLIKKDKEFIDLMERFFPKR